jgi:hypothetical protein
MSSTNVALYTESAADRSAWRQADRVAEQTQRRLGRDVDRGRDREPGLGIDR